MERLRRIANLWNWLPSFRAVAESEHLPTASARFHVSPSALSRTIGLLEEDIGQPLFRRTGRRIELTEAGGVMLRAARDAMRIVHEGLLQVTGGQLVGELHLSAHGRWAQAMLAPLIQGLREAHPALTPRFHHRALTDVPGALLAGELDIALVSHHQGTPPVGHADLSSVHLAECETGLYRAKGTPRPGPSGSAGEAPLIHASAEAPDAGLPHDFTPPVAAVCDDLLTVLQLCADGVGQCALPTALLPQSIYKPALSRVRGQKLPTSQLYALHRPTLAEPGRAEAAVAVLQSVMRAGK